jgi:hypothetical protein
MVAFGLATASQVLTPGVLGSFVRNRGIDPAMAALETRKPALPGG